MPLEILDEIFALTCSEDLDLSLLHVSRMITWKLLGHPIYRTVRAFWPVHQHGWTDPELLEIPLPGSAGRPASYGRSSGSNDREPMQQKVLRSAWCTPAFMKMLQIAFVRRMVKEYWDPFLERDGLRRCATSHPLFWDTLDRLAHEKLQVGDESLEICLKDNENRYSWTRIRIWPWQGRIVIRDQLLNRSFEKTLSFLGFILIDQKHSNRSACEETAN